MPCRAAPTPGKTHLIRNAVAFSGRILALAFALAAFTGLSSCGSGGVSGPPPVNDPTRITILPAGTASAPVIAFSGLPTTFALSGGTGAYIVSSDNQAVIQIASGAINGSTLTVVPNPVLSDTTVTISVRDTGTAPVATSVVTVKPGTVINNITITPLATTVGGCGTASDPLVCSGGDAMVTATISQGGIPLAARGVRFDVVSGNFQFVVTDPVTHADTLANSVTVNTDETGKATARIRVPLGVANQAALLQITDVGTSAFQRVSFLIAQSTGTSPGFVTSPDTITFQGTLQNQCASATVSATVFVFGGVPPYTILNTSSGLNVSPGFLNASGEGFTVTPNGTCLTGVPIIVRDSSGHTATTTVNNNPGTQALPAFSVAPTSVTLTTCDGSASVTAAGGTGTYFASSGSDAVTATVSGSTVTIRRAATGSPGTATVNVGVSDGTTTQSVTVNLSGAAAGACTGVQAAPSSVTLTSCAAQTVTLSGGSGTYTASSNNVNVTASTFGNTLTIQRTAGSASFSPPATVTVTGGNSTTVTVNATGAGLGACP